MFPMSTSILDRSLTRAAQRFGDRVAVRAGEHSWSFETLDPAVSDVAAALGRRGVQPGARVAVMMANRVEFLTSVLGIVRAGGVAVLISPAWKSTEVANAVALTAPVLGIGDDDSIGVLCAQLGAERVVNVTDGEFGSGQSETEAVAAQRADAAADADAVLVFSSGTTGMPKAVRHTHRSLGHATRHWVEALGLGPDDRFQVATPPSHILGLLNLLAAIESGATVRLHRRFDLDEVLACIEAEHMTLEMAVAPIALALANHPNLEAYDLSSLRYIMWGATPVTPSVAETVTRRSGVRWLAAYGASELPVLACNPVARPDQWRLDSAGLAPRGVELRVVDLDGGEVLASGEVGEIQARGESLMAGYLPAEATDEVFVDGWYRTGDVGWIEPDGWVHLTDRSKEMIKVSGFQVAPAEIEAVLLSHDAVVDCAVFGVADPVAGEVPAAAVQLAAEAVIREGELEGLVADELATYKRLRHVVVVDEVPRLPSGKVLRRVLRDRFAEPVGETLAGETLAGSKAGSKSGSNAAEAEQEE